MVENTNGKDTEIVNNGGEITIDDIESIRLIDMEEYIALKKAEKEKYVVYSPSLTSEAYAALLTQANDIIDLFNQIGPMMSKLSPLTQGGMDLLNADAFVNLINAVKVPADLAQQLGSLIGTISSTPVVNIVAKPLELICGAVGALAGLVYALIMNPYNMLSAYREAIRQLDIKTLKKSFKDESMPNIELAKMELNKVIIPDPDIKSYVDSGINDTMKMIDEAETMLETASNIEETMETLQNADKQMRNYLKTINTMGMNWLLPQIQQLCDILELNYEAIADALCNNNYTMMENAASRHVNDFMSMLPTKFIHVKDLEILKNYQLKQEQKDDYQSGNDDGYDDGEDSFDEYLEQFEVISDIKEVEMWKYRETKLAEKVEELKKDEESEFYISGYEEGFKKGFANRYEKCKSSEYDIGYDDGYDEGDDDCEKMTKKIGLSSMTDSNVNEYIDKMIKEKNISAKSEDYQRGYNTGYSESFHEKLNKLQGKDKSEGYNDGYDDGESGCNEYVRYMNSDAILNITEATVQTNITNIKNNNKKLTEKSTFYQSEYELGLTNGYNDALNKRKNEVQQEKNELNEETGYEAGKTKGRTEGGKEVTTYDATLSSDLGTIDRYIILDKHHDEVFNSLTIDWTGINEDVYYRKGYEEGYYYGFTDGYYSTLEIFKDDEDE